MVPIDRGIAKIHSLIKMKATFADGRSKLQLEQSDEVSNIGIQKLLGVPRQ
jgi:hypothetical protein